MKKGIIFTILSAFIFSTMEISLKLAGASINSIQLNFLRFLIGAAILLPVGIYQNKGRRIMLTMKDALFFASTGFVCIVVSMTLFVLAVQNASAGTVAVIFSCNSFFSIVLAAIILRIKTNRLVNIALAICVTGLIIIIDPLNLHASPSGIAFALGSALTFSVYTIMIKVGASIYPFKGTLPSFYTFLFGAVELLILMIITHIPAVSSALTSCGLGMFASIPIIRGITVDVLPVLIYIAFIVTGAGFALYGLAVEYGSVTIASLTFLVKPILAPILAYIVLRETQGIVQIIGILILAAGSCLIMYNSYLSERVKLNEDAKELRHGV